MFSLFHPIAPGAPRLVGPASRNYIGPHGPNFTLQQFAVPWKTLPQDKDPKFSKEMAPYIRSFNFPRIKKGGRVTVRSPRAGFAIKKPLKIGVRVSQHENPRALERTSPFDALEYSPRYFLRTGFGKGTKRLTSAKTRAPQLLAGNRAVEDLEHALMAESEKAAV